MRIKLVFQVLLLLNNFILAAPKLLIKIPTRSRPEQFFRNLDKYYENLSNEVQYLFLITCDSDDQSMNNAEIIEKLKNYKNLEVIFGESFSKVESYNRDMDKYLDFDILLVASDDAFPVEKGYDKILCDLMVEKFPDLDGVINFHDGYVDDHLNTFPVIGKKYYNRFGYIYYPGYKTMECDTEFTFISKALNKEWYIDKVLIKHDHPANNGTWIFDALYRKNEIWIEYDTKLYQERLKHNFYIDFSKS